MSDSRRYRRASARAQSRALPTLAIFRRTCDECHGQVDTFGLGEAMERRGVDWVNELLNRAGGVSGDLLFWTCRRCPDSFGMLYGLESFDT